MQMENIYDANAPYGDASIDFMIYDANASIEMQICIFMQMLFIKM